MKLSKRADSTSSHHSVLHILPPSSCLRYRCDGQSFSSLVEPRVGLKYGNLGLKLDGETRNRIGGAWGPEDNGTAQ